jgi:hypothetical protein
VTPGTLFFDSEFVFHDGESAEKILVALGTHGGLTLVIKTTSQGHHYTNSYGCQSPNRFPCFHLPKGCCCLSKPTWICLDEFYEFKDAELLQRHFSGKVNRIGLLPDLIVEDLLRCAIECPDISGTQAKVATAALSALLAADRDGA